MNTRHIRLLGPAGGPTRAGWLVLAGLVGAFAGATYLISASPGSTEARGAERPPAAARPAVAPAPTAAQFGPLLVATANDYAASHDAQERLASPHCVSPATGYYMCVYVLHRPGRSECHLVQARWTPMRASTYTITLGSRVKKCGSVRQAIRSVAP
jgi:hypothetical protein